MATWPTTLPLPQVAGFQLQPKEQSLRTDMEVGAARVRRRSLDRLDEVSLQWTLTDAQMDTLRTWFDDNAGGAGGSAWFLMRLRIGTGGIVEVEARFIGTYRASLVSATVWNVTAQLEVR